MSAPIAPTIDTNHVLALSDARAGIVALFLSTSARADAAASGSSSTRRRRGLDDPNNSNTVLPIQRRTVPTTPRDRSSPHTPARHGCRRARRADVVARVVRVRVAASTASARGDRRARGGVSRASAQKHTRPGGDDYRARASRAGASASAGAREEWRGFVRASSVRAWGARTGEGGEEGGERARGERARVRSVVAGVRGGGR